MAACKEGTARSGRCAATYARPSCMRTGAESGSSVRAWVSSDSASSNRPPVRQVDAPVQVGGRVAWVERDRPREFLIGPTRVPVERLADVAEGGMCLGQCGVEPDRGGGGGSRAGKFLARRAVGQNHQKHAGVGEAGVRLRVRGVACDRLLEVVDGAAEVARRAPAPEVTPLEVQLVGREVPRLDRRDAPESVGERRRPGRRRWRARSPPAQRTRPSNRGHTTPTRGRRCHRRSRAAR